MMENEPKLLMHIRWVSNNRRRMNNEKLDAVGNVGLRATIVNEFASKLTKERREDINTSEIEGCGDEGDGGGLPLRDCVSQIRSRIR